MNSHYFAEYPEDFEAYSREYLLNRAEDLFSKKKKNVLPNLDYQKLNRKTYIRNIQAIAEKLGRSVEDLRVYFAKELRVGVSIKDDGSLKLDKVFHPKDLNPVYTSFIKTIQCDGCKSIRTTEPKENRITFLKCEDCGQKVAKK